MSFVISWTREYETGIDIIDAQHKRIFDYLEEIDQAIKTNNADDVEYVIKSLIDYAISHNAFEEGLMEQAGYPMLEAHQQVHDAFSARAHAYQERISKGEDRFRVAREIRTDIGLWLTNHIKRDDQHYVSFVKRNIEGGFVTRLLDKLFG